MSANTELSRFLRVRRAAVRPDSVGLEAGDRRRVPGLRREELARLAGVSVDYYTRLEQGRHITPSEAVLDAIAGALALGDAERNYLRELARARALPNRRRTPGPQHLRPGLIRLLDTLGEVPAFVLGRRTDVLAANGMARMLIADFNAMPARERNAARWFILDEGARELFRDWETVAAEMVGALRLDAGRYPDDPRTAELVGELAMKSGHFRRWWADHRVVELTHHVKHLRHPLIGSLEFETEALTLPGDTDQTLLVFMPTPASPTAEALALLGSLTSS